MVRTAAATADAFIERFGAQDLAGADADFAAPYPALGQPTYAPWRLALARLMQFRKGESSGGVRPRLS